MQEATFGERLKFCRLQKAEKSARIIHFKAPNFHCIAAAAGAGWGAAAVLQCCSAPGISSVIVGEL